MKIYLTKKEYFKDDYIKEQVNQKTNISEKKRPPLKISKTRGQGLER